MDWRTATRTPLGKGAKIILDHCVIVNDDEPSEVLEGGTCLVYHGHVESGAGIVSGNKVIIKEFYPESQDTIFDISREGDMLSIAKSTKEAHIFLSKYKQYMQGLESQKELARSKAMEVAVKPWFEGWYGDSYYIVSDVHTGEDMEKYQPENLSDKVAMAVSVAEMMDILHNAGYIMLDFKPANLMYVKKPRMVKVLDVDSLIDYRNDTAVDKMLYSNMMYASPEVTTLNALSENYVSDSAYQAMRKNYLQPISDVYSMGVYFSQLFLGVTPRIQDRKKEEEQMYQQFMELHKNEPGISEKKLAVVGKRIANIVYKATITNRQKRKKLGYATAESMMKDLMSVYHYLTSEIIVTKKEVAKANTTFVAYDMLQKYPLYDYASIDTNGVRKLKVAIYGNYVMRTEMLSAIISIGQMLNSTLDIYLVSEDAREFWNRYLKKNPGLSRAVTWSCDGEICSDEIDEKLVDRSLAAVHLLTEDTDSRCQQLYEEGCKYFILLHEDVRENEKLLKTLSSAKDSFIGVIQTEEEVSVDTACGMDISIISVDSFTEYYNEKMFEAQIFKMGMMAHAYYCGYMNEDADVDMEDVENEFRKNLYNVASSERCALHGIYKMASIGLDIHKPGRILNYYRKIQNQEFLEKLIWMEHLSWCAYMLTTGAMPIDIKNMNEYAYQKGNDWKKKDGPNLMHPVLAAGKPKMGLLDHDWSKTLSDEQIDNLDALDMVSYQMHRWYIDHKEEFRGQLHRVLEMVGENNNIFTGIKEYGDKIIDAMGTYAEGEHQEYISEWKCKMKEASICFPENRGISEIDKVMKPVLDFYRERDFKKVTGEMVFAVVDMIV